MVRLEVRITRLQTLMYCSATTGTVSVPTTADTIDEVDENFSIAWNCFGYGYNYRQ
jgi:hypothetical protein